VVVDEDVLVRVVRIVLHDLADAKIKGLDVVFFVVRVSDDADGLQRDPRN
jgi:hypothetical protein